MVKENRIVFRIYLIFLFCILALLLFNAYSLAQEEIKITTYYPSPFGIYAELNVADRMAIGDADGDGSKDAGDLPVDTSGNPTDGLALGGNLIIGSNVINTDYELQIHTSTDKYVTIGDMDVGGHTYIGLHIAENESLGGDGGGIWYNYSADRMAISSSGRIDIDTHGDPLVLQDFADGSVGIRMTPDPSYALDVHGTIHADGADLAENFYVEGNVKPGDIVVISDKKDERLIKSSQAYSLRVAGVISEEPGLCIGEKKEGQLPLGLVGQVPCKVNDENGPIKKGDLIVSSSTPGFGMKAEFISLKGIDNFPQLTKAIEENARRRQSVIGKALESLAGNEGKVNVLLKK